MLIDERDTMLQRLLRHCTYANVAATLALFVALTAGTAFAAALTGSNILDGSLTGRDLATGSVRGIDVAALTPEDFANTETLPIRNLTPDSTLVDEVQPVQRTIGALRFRPVCSLDPDTQMVRAGYEVTTTRDGVMIDDDVSLDTGESHFVGAEIAAGADAAGAETVAAVGAGPTGDPDTMWSIVVQGGLVSSGTPACSTAGIVVQGGIIVQGGLATRGIIVQGG